MYDVDGKEYIDFLTGYSSMSQGHVHPKIMKAAISQMCKVPLTSRAFYNKRFCEAQEFCTKYFGYQRILYMNSGAEAVESAIKISRKWAYEVKKIPDGTAKFMAFNGNFHGRTLTVCGASDDPGRFKQMGPFCKEGVVMCDYNDIEMFEKLLVENAASLSAVLMEAVQGESGITIPKKGHLAKMHELCKKHKVLLICDEVQTGLCRTGKLLCQDHEGVHADLVTLGKALSGGFYPVSAVLADDEVMLCLKPGEHGSTFGGNPLASAIATAALTVLQEEKLAERAAENGPYFMDLLRVLEKHPLVKEIRGIGLLCAIEVSDKFGDHFGWDMCLRFLAKGIATKPTHATNIRYIYIYYIYSVDWHPP